MKYTSFVLQVFLPLDIASPLRQRLHEIVRATAQRATYADKWNFYRLLSETIGPWAPHFEYGVWDYVEAPELAEAEYQKWCLGTVQDMQDAAEIEAIAAAYRQSGGPRHMFITLLFLMRRGAASDKYVCEMCRIPEATWWTKETFRGMLSSIAALNFESVRSDAVYIRPGLDERGITGQELALEQYQYLKKLQ